MGRDTERYSLRTMESSILMPYILTEQRISCWLGTTMALHFYLTVTVKTLSSYFRGKPYVKHYKCTPFII